MTQDESFLLYEFDEKHQQCCRSCGIDKCEKLAEHAVVHVVCCHGKVARVMHMVCTLHTVGSDIGYGLVTVQSRE